METSKEEVDGPTVAGDPDDAVTKIATSSTINTEDFDPPRRASGVNSYKPLMNREHMATLDEGDDESFGENHSCSTNGSDHNSIAQNKKMTHFGHSSNLIPLHIANFRDSLKRQSSFSEHIDVTKTNLRSDNGELFAQKIQIRKHQTNPKSRLHRTVADLSMADRRLSISKSFRRLLTSGTESEDLDSDSVSEKSDKKDNTVEKKQFTVTLEREVKNPFNRLIHMISPDEYSYSPNELIVTYINWTFASTFPRVLFCFMVLYFIICLIFALFIKIAGNAEPECIVLDDEKFDQSSTKFLDSFHLSWTTFTTVGYGAAYTATGVEHPNQWECMFITIICAIESFAGLLYVGFCTAILFGKVGRIQSHAQVSFSNVICIQHGNVAANSTNDRNEGDTVRDLCDSFIFIQDESISSKIACPILKFQLINKLANMPGGDILDAKINVVGRREMDKSEETLARYVKVRMQETTHPFFTRVWHCTHILNKNSSLLSHETRRAIEANDGFWPNNMLTPEKVRESLTFDKIIITLTGISDLSAANVQIAKKYEIRDVLIGYDFAPMVYKEEHAGKPEKDRLKVDMSLEHDIIEQKGNTSLIEKPNEQRFKPHESTEQ